jgi:uncharacterized protein YjbJ (UPF0337 family)
MKLPFVIAIASGVALAAYVLINTPGPEYATGNDSIEDAARGTAQWGSKKRVAGAGNSVLGKLKEGAGRVTGDQDLASDGLVDQAAGAVKDAAGQVAQAAGKTLHELNR